MKKRMVALTAVFTLLIFALTIFSTGATAVADWTNGTASDMDYGFTKLSSTDTRGHIPAPNLEEGPYYLMLGMDGLMPGGSSTEGGRWGQLHLSDGERNNNWNPAGEIYIVFPNSNANPRNITVSTGTNGETIMMGAPFTPHTAYVFKFAKENDMLVIYCNGINVFEGAEQLSVFSGTDLWFTSMGNEGAYDTFKSYPLFINPEPGITANPVNYYYTGPKWGNDKYCTPPLRDIMVNYTPDGSARMLIQSEYGNGDVGQSISTDFLNSNNKFEMHLTCETFNYDTWQVIGLRPYENEGSPLEEPNVLCVEMSNGPTFQMFYRKTDGTRINIVPATLFELGVDLKLRFELVEDSGNNSVKIYANDQLLYSGNDGDLVSLMKSVQMKLITVGNTTYQNPNVTLIKLDNDPPEVVLVDPEDSDKLDPDPDPNPYKNLVLTSVNGNMTINDILITVTRKMTATQLANALIVPEDCKIYIMDKNEELADGDAIIDSTYSIMLVLDDGYDTYIRSYSLYVADSDGNPYTGDVGLNQIPYGLVLLSVIALALMKKRKLCAHYHI